MDQSIKPLLLVCIATLLVSACGGGGSSRRSAYDDEGKERISILTSASDLRADEGLAVTNVILPSPYRNGSWSQHGGNAKHVVQHLDVADNLSRAWQADIGSGDQSYERMVTGPVADAGRVFAMDVKGDIIAIELSTGRQLWRVETTGREDRSKVGYGGGLAVGEGRVYATHGHGYVAALDSASGREIWRYTAGIPFRGAPTFSEGRVFALTSDNQLIALNSENGEYLWDQVGISESAGMLGAASPASDGGSVVVAMSSGELFMMLTTNGQILWQDTLASSRRLTPLATLADIDGEPVIYKNRVYAVSHAGSLVAIDLRTGERSWEADVASVTMPWIAGNYAYLVTIDGQVACISLTDGRTRWVSQLQRFEKQKKRKGLIKWNGPVLAGDRLIVTSSHGYILSISPYTGEVLSGDRLPAGSNLPHIVVDGTLVVQTTEGELVAYR